MSGMPSFWKSALASRLMRGLMLAAVMLLATSAMAAEFITKLDDPPTPGLLSLAESQQWELEKRVVMVAFVDCNSDRCEQALPALENRVQARLGSNPRFQLVAVVVDASEADAKGLATRLGVTFPLVADPKREIFREVAADGVPRVLIYNLAGKLAYQHSGFRPGREIEFFAVADQLLRGKPVPNAARRGAGAGPAAGQVSEDLGAVSVVGLKAPDVPVEKWINPMPADSEGKYLMVDFWATWCGPCVVALDEAEKLHGQFDAQLVTMAVSDEPESKVAAFAKKRGWKQPIGVDTQRRAANDLQIRGIPHAFLVEPKSGKVIWQGHPMELWRNNGERLRQLMTPSAPSDAPPAGEKAP